MDKIEQWNLAFDLLKDKKFDDFKKILNNDFDINSWPGNQNALIYWFSDDYDISTFLLESGADPNIIPEHKRVSLNNHINSTSPQKLSFIRLFLEYGANPNIKDFKDKTAFDIAMEVNDSQIFKLLLQYPERLQPQQLKKLKKYKLRSLIY